MKKLITLIAFCCMIGTVNAQYAIHETFGTVTGNTPLAKHTFDNTKLSFTGTAQIRQTVTSYKYAKASGGACVFIPKAEGIYLQIANINTSAMDKPVLAFGIYKGAPANDASDLSIQYSTNEGKNWKALPAVSFDKVTGWYYREIVGLPKSENLAIRFIKTGAKNFFFIDDVSVDTAQ